MSEINTIERAPRRGLPVWAQIIVWIVLLGLLAIVSLSLSRAQQGSAKPGEVIPTFNLTFFDGYRYQDQKQISLADLRGKVVLINFWASWCIPCEEEAAELEAAWKYYQPSGKVVFLGIDYVDTETQALAFLKQYGITYPNGPDLQTRISPIFRITGVPETYVVDQSGKLVLSRISPFETEEQIRQIIDPLIK